MNREHERIGKFLGVCTELVEGKFPTAEAKISEALAAIAASRRLTELFTAVTQEFDYAAAKRSYLRYPAREGSSRGMMLLPAGRSELLAFVFCLFVEMDAGAMQLGEFLLRYCYVDGSYTASYSMFAERVVRPFRDIVRDCFPALGRGDVVLARKQQEACIAKIAELLPVEQTRLAGLNLRDEEVAAADLLLAGLAAAAGKMDVAELSAMLAGYRYFLRYIGGENETSAAIFDLAAQL